MKIYNYMILLTGLILLFEMSGIPTGAQGILNIVGLGTGSAEITTSNLYLAIFGSAGLFVVGVAAGLIVGFFTRTSPENYIILPLITGTLAVFAGSFISIINYSLANHEIWISSIILLILGVLTMGYIISLVEFFRGTD